MAQQTLNDGETGLVIRGKINDNFTEVYGNGLIAYSEGTWVPSFTGFSAAPTVSAARYTSIGRLCTCMVAMSANGTSNATTATMTLPFAAANTVVQTFAILAVDSGTIGADPGKLNTRVNSNIADLYKTLASGTWTGSGAKGWTFTITYEIAE